MVKSINIRIILGFVIVLTLLLCPIVHAQEVIQSPISMFVYNPDQNSTNLSITQSSKSSITLWGYSFTTYQPRESLVFMYNTPSNLKNKNVDLHFLIYNDLWSNQLQPDRVVVKNNTTGSINSCVVSSSSRKFKEETLTQPSSKFNTVICENVVLTDDKFQVYLFDNFESSSYTFVGISRIYAKNNSTSSSSDIKNSIDKQTQEQKKTNDTITNDSVDNSKANSTIDSAKSKLASNGSITQLLTLPITLYQSILNATNGSCSPFNLGSLYNHNLTLPCINLTNLLGSTLYNIIDILLCGSFILAFRKKMVDIFNHMSSLNDRGNEVE